jgi:hypothetical protein
MFTDSRPLPRLAAIFCLLLLLAPIAASAAPSDGQLSAADILRAVREGQASRHETLSGQLRNDSDGKTFPFRLVADGPLVRYQFAGPPPTTVQVRYNEENSQLEESSGNGPAERLSPANFDKPVLGTTLTYEDMALRFVYWSRASMQEPDDATTFPAWKLRLNAPSPRSQYAYVLLWVAKDSGALSRAEGYDRQGKLIKRFYVVSGQKIGGKWYLKQMRIENVDPASGKVSSRTYLEIKGVEK